MTERRWGAIDEGYAEEGVTVERLLAGLTSEMRWAVDRLRTGPMFVGAVGIPRGTAEALHRRGLVTAAGGSKVGLTPLGRQVAIARLRARPPDDDAVRIEAVLDSGGYADYTRFAPGCLDSDLGVLKEWGRLIDYEINEDGTRVRITADVPRYDPLPAGWSAI